LFSQIKVCLNLPKDKETEHVVSSITEKAKPAVRQGRKVTGLEHR